MSPRPGFTLIEVVVATALLGVGLLGAAGMGVLAATTLGEARRIEWAVGVVEEVADSVVAAGGSGSGVRSDPPGTVRWEPAGPGGVIRVRAWRGPAEGAPVLETFFRAPALRGGA